jgi:hypothetical protein
LTSAVESIEADGTTLDGDLQFETSGSATLSVSGNTLTFGAGSGGTSGVETDGTLDGSGTSGSPLGIAEDGVGTTELADGSVTGSRIADAAIQGGDNVSVARDGSDNFVVSASTDGLTSAVESIEADGTTLDGDLQFETSGSASLSVSGNTLTFGAGGDGGGSGVETDGTLDGDGTNGDPLGLADEAVTAANLAADAVGSDALATDAVTEDAVATGAVGTDEVLDASLAAEDLNAQNSDDDYVLTYDGDATGGFVWRDPDADESSRRFKTEIETIDDAQSLLDQLRGVRFQWKDDGDPDIGLIAEEVAKVFPELVTYEADGSTIRGLRYAPLVAVLIEAAKKQRDALDAASETIETQRTELDALSDRVDRLEALVQEMSTDTDTSTQ